MASVDLLNYITESVECKILKLAAFQGYVSEQDICDIINNQLGTTFQGDEKKIYRMEDLKD